MADVVTQRRAWIDKLENVLGHIAAVVIGFVMMVVGLGLGVTMVMLPFGLVIGLLGLAIFVSGLFMRLDEGKRP
jgi:archaellum biogenesis protein FlaJ (TadC family)